MTTGKNLARRRLIATSTLGAAAFLALAFFAVINYFGWKYHQRFDWTGSKLYTLSEKSENVVRELSQDIEVLVFMNPGEQLYAPVRELLARYEAASPKISVREVDAERNLVEAQQVVDRFQLDRINVIVFATAEGKKVIEVGDLAEFDYSGVQYGQMPQMTGFKGEQAFTSALLELDESRRPRVIFTSGHGERQVEDMSTAGLSALRDLLQRDNFEVESWGSLGETEVPAGTDLVVIAGPTSTFLPPELALLSAYLRQGGRLLVMLDPELNAQGDIVATGLEPFLESFGAVVGNDIVIDPSNPLPFFGAETIFINNYGDHIITRSLSEAQLPVIIPLGRSITALEDAEMEAVELLQTTAEGWAETGLATLPEVEKGEDDLPGPVSLALALSSPEPADVEAEGVAVEDEEIEERSLILDPEGSQAEFRLVVIGDSDFVSSGQLQNAPNETFIANAVNWLVERETLVGIPPKAPEQVRLSLSQGQLRFVIWTVLAIIPGIVIAFGMLIYMRRRR